MSTPAQIGKREYRAALRQARKANQEARVLLRRLVQEVGNGLAGTLAGRVGMAIGENDDALNRLQEIGEAIADENK